MTLRRYVIACMLFKGDRLCKAMGLLTWIAIGLFILLVQDVTLLFIKTYYAR